MIRPEIGVQVYSTGHVYGDGLDIGSSTGKGGIVVDRYEETDTETGEKVEKVVAVQRYRGRIRYNHLRCDEIVYGDSDGLVNTFFVKQLAKALHEDTARHPNHDHLHALLALSTVTANK